MRVWAKRPVLGFAAVVALWAMLAWLCVLYVDRPFATFAHDALRRPAWSVWLTWIAWAPYALAVGVLPGALLWRGLGRRLGRHWGTALRAAAAVVLAFVLVALLKYVAGRTWPETWTGGNPSWIRDHAFGFAPLHAGLGWRSFPSGHVARVAAPCAVAWWRLASGRMLWVLLPGLTAAGLLVADYHFVSDCVAGGLVGFGVGSALAWPVRRNVRRAA